MSVSKWRYEKECDGRPCVGDCDFCSYETTCPSYAEPITGKERWESGNCGNCKHQAELIMWERIQRGEEMAYLPNYNNPLTCCTALVGLKDGSNGVYGHTEPHNGFCEMWKER